MCRSGHWSLRSWLSGPGLNSVRAFFSSPRGPSGSAHSLPLSPLRVPESLPSVRWVHQIPTLHTVATLHQVLLVLASPWQPSSQPPSLGVCWVSRSWSGVVAPTRIPSTWKAEGRGHKPKAARAKSEKMSSQEENQTKPPGCSNAQISRSSLLPTR